MGTVVDKTWRLSRTYKIHDSTEALPATFDARETWP